MFPKQAPGLYFCARICGKGALKRISSRLKRPMHVPGPINTCNSFLGQEEAFPTEDSEPSESEKTF